MEIATTVKTKELLGLERVATLPSNCFRPGAPGEFPVTCWTGRALPLLMARHWLSFIIEGGSTLLIDNEIPTEEMI